MGWEVVGFNHDLAIVVECSIIQVSMFFTNLHCVMIFHTYSCICIIDESLG